MLSSTGDRRFSAGKASESYPRLILSMMYASSWLRSPASHPYCSDPLAPAWPLEDLEGNIKVYILGYRNIPSAPCKVPGIFCILVFEAVLSDDYVAAGRYKPLRLFVADDTSIILHCPEEQVLWIGLSCPLLLRLVPPLADWGRGTFIWVFSL